MICRLRIRKPALRNKSCGDDPPKRRGQQLRSGVAPPQSEQVKFSGQNCASLQKSPSADCTSNCWEAQTDCMNRHHSCAHLRRSPAPSVLTSRCAVCIQPNNNLLWWQTRSIEGRRSLDYPRQSSKSEVTASVSEEYLPEMEVNSM